MNSSIPLTGVSSTGEQRAELVRCFLKQLSAWETGKTQYQPAISAVRTRSRGYAHRVFCSVAERILHLQSNHEYHAALLFRYSGQFSFILEAVGLPLAATQGIAGEHGIRHPRDRFKKADTVMTVDFLNLRTDGRWVAFDIKPVAHLQRRRVKEKLHLTRMFLLEAGIEHVIVTERAMPKETVDSLRIAAAFAAPFDPPPFNDEEIREVVPRLKTDLLSGVKTLRDAAHCEEVRSGIAPAKCIRGMLWLVATRRWRVHYGQPLGPDDSIKFMKP